MSIPVDFVGLNTLMVKKPGSEKNQLTTIKELKFDHLGTSSSNKA